MFHDTPSANVQHVLLEFVKLHVDDQIQDWKLSWARWVKEHKSMIEEETSRLRKLGYEGDVVTKMHNSARYYLSDKVRNKRNGVTNKPKARRKTIKISKKMSDCIVLHAKKYITQPTRTKPSKQYNDFVVAHKEAMTSEREYMKRTYGIADKEFEVKIKKSFKNIELRLHKEKANSTD
jgi:hypothetical protein